jgi:hypothetical protein
VIKSRSVLVEDSRKGREYEEQMRQMSQISGRRAKAVGIDNDWLEEGIEVYSVDFARHSE